MMTGIPIENNLWTAYLLTIFFVVVGFAVYDVLYRRVPDRALVFFIPLASLAPVLQGYFLLNHGLPPLFLWPVATHALVGALLGFCIPLAAALATNGTGLGGGDIKFCGILGLVYGPSGMALVFLTAAVTMPKSFVKLRTSCKLVSATTMTKPWKDAKRNELESPTAAMSGKMPFC